MAIDHLVVQGHGAHCRSGEGQQRSPQSMVPRLIILQGAPEIMAFMPHSFAPAEASAMRLRTVSIAALTVLPGFSLAAERTVPPGCLTQAEMREVLAQEAVVAPITAVRAARSKSGGKVIRASLCRNADDFVYQITTLQKDGRVVRVTIDGRSGEIEATR